MRAVFLAAIAALCLTATVYNIFKNGSEVFKLEHAHDQEASEFFVQDGYVALQEQVDDDNYFNTINKESQEPGFLGKVAETLENEHVIEEIQEILTDLAEGKGLTNKQEAELLKDLSEVLNNEKTAEELKEIFFDLTDTITKKDSDEYVDDGEYLIEELLGEGDDEGSCDGEDCDQEFNFEAALEEILQKVDDDEGACGDCDDSDCEGCNDEYVCEEILGEGDDEGSCDGEDCEEEEEVANGDEVVADLPEETDKIAPVEKISEVLEREVLAKELLDETVDTA
jgi:hypothetical protein